MDVAVGTVHVDEARVKVIETGRETRPSALLVAPAGRAHHFAGVPEALDAIGWRSTCEVLQPHAPVRVTRAMAQAAKVIVHADGVNANAIGIWNAAERGGRPVALVMDGVLEFANTFLNTAAGREFLRPAPAHVVLAAGAHDAAILHAMGNNAAPSGLPRLGAFEARYGEVKQRESAGVPRDVLIATANQVAFTEGGRRRIVASLMELRDAIARRGLRARWRVNAELAELLGVAIDRDPLEMSLARSCAVISTASTLVLEAMIARVPVAVLHPHPWPLWIPAAWRWDGTSREQWDDDARRAADALEDPIARGANAAALASVELATSGQGARAPGTAGELLRAVLDPDADARETQARALAHCYAYSAATRAASAIVRAAGGSTPGRGAAGRCTPARHRSVRVVSLIEAHAASVGGVSVWNERMAAHLNAHPDLNVRWEIVPISGDPGPLRASSRDAAERSTGPDPTASLPEQIEWILDRVRPDERTVVLPNYGDLAHAAAIHARTRGARVIATAHTNDEVFRGFLSRFDAWDAAVAVSDACEPWVRAMAGGRAVARIVYGVPMHATRERCSIAADAPLRLAYVGRVVEAQKRVSDLLQLLEHLRRLGTRHELHIVGDGDALPAWRRDAERRGLLDSIVLHGPRGQDWVQRFWSGVDVCVITSVAEGTSIAMLEAMAAGVMPCVTRVDAGVDAFVRDGQSGVAVPVGDMQQMATRLDALWRDRERLAVMAAAAQRTILDHGLSIDACARAWARLAHEVCGAPHARPVVTDRSLRAPGSVPATRGAATADQIAGHLAGAGFARVVRGVALDEAAGTAMVVRATDPRPSRATIDAWRARGVGAAVEPTLLDDDGPPIGVWFREACEAGASRVAVCAGPGLTTSWLEWFAEHAGHAFAGFVHPAARERELAGEQVTLLGAAAASPSAALAALRPGAVVLTCVDEDLVPYAATWVLRRDGVRVHPTPSDAGVRALVDEAMRAAHETTRRGERVATTLPAGTIEGASQLAEQSADALAACRLVVLRGDESDFEWAARLADMIERGVQVRSMRWTSAEITSPARLARMITEIRGERYAIFGAGLHTRRLLTHARLSYPPTCVLDDQAHDGERIAGVEVVAPERAMSLGVRAVVLSSPRHEVSMWRRTEALRKAGVRVLPMYGDAAALEQGR